MKKKLAVLATLFFLGVGFGTVISISIYTGYHREIMTMVFSFDWLPVIVTMVSVPLTVLGIFTLTWMLYAWENPNEAKRHKSPEVFVPVRFTFTALVPARNEENVIGATIRAISAIEYPEVHKELLVLCREDDEKTIREAKRVIEEIGKPNMRLVVFDGHPVNKPYALNTGLRRAMGDVITVFDAEDQPHKDIYNIVNTLMVAEGVDVVQSGVQLMNYQSRWFSAFVKYPIFRASIPYPPLNRFDVFAGIRPAAFSVLNESFCDCNNRSSGKALQ